MDNEVEAKSTTVDSQKSVLPVVQMANGRFACNHVCRDGNPLKNGLPCKHKCCKEGLEKPRKAKARVSRHICVCHWTRLTQDRLLREMPAINRVRRRMIAQARRILRVGTLK